LQDKPKKNLFKVLFIITILLSFTITLVGCNWFAFGLLNIIDPQAQIRIDFNPEDAGDPVEGCFNLGVSSINEVEFFITGFSYDYHGNHYTSGEINIPELSREIEASYYVKPSSTPGTPGDVTLVKNIPLYVQEVADYVTLDPFITEVNCDIDLIGVDGSGHNQTIPIISSLPVLQPGVDITPPVADFTATPESGNAPLTVVFDASILSTDERGIASYSWDFGDSSTGSGIIVEHTYDTVGTYNVILTVTDYFGNKGYKTKSIQVNYFTDITIIVVAVPASFTSVGGTSTITAYVVDSVGEPVEGVRVIFNTEGGTLSATSGTTDADGKATVTLTVPANTTAAAIVYQVTANVGSESGSTSITIHEP
jgi:PKD repeat protein